MAQFSDSEFFTSEHYVLLLAMFKKTVKTEKYDER